MIRLPSTVSVGVLAAIAGASCKPAQSQPETLASLRPLDSQSDDYCSVPPVSTPVLNVRPADHEDPIDDVNWFARPVPHDGTDHLVAFASHNENYLYNLTNGTRIRIPDRSDAVATPDGRYMTVPSLYTPDSTIRFYDVPPLLASLARGEDASALDPAYVHNDPLVRRVYYQSTAVVSEDTTADALVTTYRLMFSGTADRSGFRIVDYRFSHDRTTGSLQRVDPSPPMQLCREITNDLNTPFISKDGRYVAAYTSDTAAAVFSPGASLKLFEITGTHPAHGTASCRAVLDFGFAAGKADFSFDGSMLTFHISQGAYLTPFVNGGLDTTTITDVVVADLARNDRGDIVGHRGLRRLTTSLAAGVGSYFPAFFPDGALFYIGNAVPKSGPDPKRFHFRVMAPGGGPWLTELFDPPERVTHLRTLAEHWERSCRAAHPVLSGSLFPLAEHEAPWLILSLTGRQCHALLDDARSASGGSGSADWAALGQTCDLLGG